MVKKATAAHCRTLAEMAVKMWDSHSVDDLQKEFGETILSKNAVFFIKYADNIPVGFAQCGLRNDYVEGTESSPVGYLEGIFVEEAYRKRTYANELLAASEAWAKDMGCTEFASDCELDNVTSLKFHIAMGFEEANRIICFKKNI